MKSIIYTFLFSILGLIAVSQTTFEYKYDYSTEDIGTSVYELPTGGYVVCGYEFDDVNGDYDVFVSKIDDNGDEIWHQTYTSIGIEDDWANYINSTSDNGFILAGGVTDPDNGDTDAFLLKINSSGNEVWQEVYGDISEDEANYVVELSDGSIAFCGSSIDGAELTLDAWLVITDDEGVLIEEGFYGLNGIDEANTVVETNDGGFVICGSSWDVNNVDSDGLVIKTDANGDEEWIYFTTGNVYDVLNDIIDLSNGDFVIVGSEEDGTVGDDDLLIERITDDGSAMVYSWTFDYDAEDDEATRIYTDGTDYYLVGYVTDGTTMDMDAYIANIDVAAGDINWDELYGDVFDDEFLDFDFTSDNGFICVGYSFANSNDIDMYLVKTNEDGTVGLNDKIAVSSNLSILPNPAHDFVNISNVDFANDMIPIKITTMDGKLVLSESIIAENNKINIEISGFAKGYYLIETIQNAKICHEKLIIQ